MTFIAIIGALLAVILLQNRGSISQKRLPKIASLGLFILSGVLLSFDYGPLRGVFILIALVSVLGTLFTLLRYKLNS